MVSDDQGLKVGTPTVEGATVDASLSSRANEEDHCFQVKAKRGIVVKKATPPYTRVRIQAIHA